MHTHRSSGFFKVAVFVEFDVSLGDYSKLLLVCVQIHDLIRDVSAAVYFFHHSVRSFDKSKIIDPGIAGQMRYEADVWAFWRSNRAKSAVVRTMHVPDFEAGAFSGKSAWAHG